MSAMIRDATKKFLDPDSDSDQHSDYLGFFCAIVDISWTFQQNPSKLFRVILQINRQLQNLIDESKYVPPTK